MPSTNTVIPNTTGIEALHLKKTIDNANGEWLVDRTSIIAWSVDMLNHAEPITSEYLSEVYALYDPAAGRAWMPSTAVKGSLEQVITYLLDRGLAWENES